MRGDRIARITPRGMLANATARERVDATGMVVSPGFIDIQGQSGGAFLFGDGRDVGKLVQGVTTEILGEGSTPKLQLAQPWIKIGTDAGGHDPDSTRSLVHPRSYGTYPRILGKYVRDEHVLTLEDAVRKMSAAKRVLNRCASLHAQLYTTSCPGLSGLCPRREAVNLA